MKHLDVLKQMTLNKGTQTINLERIFPVEPITDQNVTVTYYVDDEKQDLIYDCYYANKLVIDAAKPQALDIFIGQGYDVLKNDELTHRFISHDGWSGGDGIYSFNLENGHDHFDQKSAQSTLFVFGDTFVGRSDQDTKQRFQPHLMPNNSLAYLKDDQLTFHLNTESNGGIKAFYEIDPQFDVEGPIPENLISYHQKKERNPFLSGYHPKQVTLTFDLFETTEVTHIDIVNYFSKESDTLSKRGAKDIKIEGSHDLTHFELMSTHVLKQNQHGKDVETIKINQSYRYFRLILLNNHNDDTFKEGLTGLNQVRFYKHQRLLSDVAVESDSVMQRERSHAWLWLQDGVVIKDHLYFMPLIVNSDQTQPEGLQFKIDGVAMIKTPIENQKIIPEKSTQKMAPVLVQKGDSEYLFGGAIMSLTDESGAHHPDGYIYIYGYKTTLGLREMIVARVKPEQFELMNHWAYFDGKAFTENILDAAPLLAHISCEFSVSPIHEGMYKDQFLAVFTYDVNTPYLAYAVGKTPYGPFKKPQTIYKTPEQDIFKSTTYTYNAKAHPHLSKSTEILVSYNTNTYNFDHNMSNYLIYRPRFVTLKDTTK